MLSPEDRDLTKRDVALPALEALLDPSAFAALLQQELPGRQVGSVLPTYLRYKPGTSCLAGYRAEVDGATTDLHGFTSVVERKLRVRSRDALTGGPLGTLGRAVPGLPVMIRAFPNDAGLKVLHRITDPVERRRLLPPEFAEATWATLRYKPERRWVARFDAPTTRAVVKVHGAHAVGGAIRGATTFRSEANLALAPLLHTDPTQGIVALGWLEGSVLNDLFTEGWDPAGVEAVGRALATLHAQRMGTIDGGVAPPSQSLRELGETLGVLVPSRAGMVRTQTATLIGALHELAEPSTWIHGDCYAKQILIAGSTVGILDFDEARPGDPAEDLGNFRAHLLLETIRGRVTTEYADRIWAALLAGYGSNGENWFLRLQLQISIGCLRLAPNPFRHREPNWSRNTAQLIDLSIAALAPLLSTASLR